MRRVQVAGNPKLWLAFGLVAGIAMMNKISIGFFGFGIVVGLLLTAQRRQFLNPWIWAGGATAVLIFLPNVIWQYANDWPTLEFIRNNAAGGKISPMSPAGYLLAQLIDTNPFTAPIWVAGLGYFLVSYRPRHVGLIQELSLDFLPLVCFYQIVSAQHLLHELRGFVPGFLVTCRVCLTLAALVAPGSAVRLQKSFGLSIPFD